MTSTHTAHAGDAFRAGVEAGDLDAMRAALAPEIVFHSPVTFWPFCGRETAGELLGVVFETLEDFRYTDELHAGATSVLVFRARVGERELEGVDIVRTDADGLIEDFTVMMRPMSGLAAFAQLMGERLAAAGVAPTKDA